MQLPQIKIDMNILMLAAILLTFLISMVNIFMLLSYSGQATDYMGFLGQKIDSTNHSQNQTTEILGRISAIQGNQASDEKIISSLRNTPIPKDRSAEIATLEANLTRLQRQYNDLKNYVESINITNTTQIIYVNQTAPANSSADIPAKTNYLCDITGVPSGLLFQYHYQCACNLRTKYGPDLNVGGQCYGMNHDTSACACYDIICSSQPAGLC